MLQHADSKEAAELCMPLDADMTYDARGGATGFTDSEGSAHRFDQAGIMLPLVSFVGSLGGC